MNEEMIKFIMHALGCDRATVLQLYKDWVRSEEFVKAVMKE